MAYISFKEVKEMLKKSIDETTNINEALEKTVQFIYSKGYEDGSRRLWIPCSEGLQKVKVGTYVFISKKPLGFRSNLPNVCMAHKSRDP